MLLGRPSPRVVRVDVLFPDHAFVVDQAKHIKDVNTILTRHSRGFTLEGVSGPGLDVVFVFDGGRRVKTYCIFNRESWEVYLPATPFQKHVWESNQELRLRTFGIDPDTRPTWEYILQTLKHYEDAEERGYR